MGQHTLHTQPGRWTWWSPSSPGHNSARERHLCYVHCATYYQWDTAYSERHPHNAALATVDCEYVFHLCQPRADCNLVLLAGAVTRLYPASHDSSHHLCCLLRLRLLHKLGIRLHALRM